MFYCEINEEGFCYHSTTNELPPSNTIILSEENMIGKIWNGVDWVEAEQERSEAILTQEDRIEAKADYIIMMKGE